jgi:hypothetical protein
MSLYVMCEKRKEETRKRLDQNQERERGKMSLHVMCVKRKEETRKRLDQNQEGIRVKALATDSL